MKIYLKKPIKVYTSSIVKKIEEGKVYIEANKDRIEPYTPWLTLVPENVHNPFDKKLDPNNTELEIIDTDYIIFATGGVAGDSLYYELNKKFPSKEIYCVGDARRPARAWEAITAANEIGRFI